MGKFNELKRIPVSPRHAFPRLSKACGATRAREEDSETYAAAERPPNSSGIFKQQSDQAPAQMEAMMLTPTQTVPTDANEPGPPPPKSSSARAPVPWQEESANERDPYPRRYE